MNYVQFHVGDWDTSTRLLSPTEKGVYIDLLMLYYSLERPLMRSECDRISRAYTNYEREAMEYILERYFQRSGDSYAHRRCDAEIAACRAKSAKAAASAKARWGKASKRSGKVVANSSQMHEECESDTVAIQTQCKRISERNADGMLTNNQKPITTNTKEKEEKESAPLFSSSETSSEDKPKTSLRSKPKTPCPFSDDEVIPEDYLRYANEKHPTIDAEKEFRKYVNFNLSKDGRYCDWLAAWRTWLSNAEGYASTARKPGMAVNGRTGFAQRDDYNRRLQACCRGEGGGERVADDGVTIIPS